MEYVISFIVTVAANLATGYIRKWLDGKKDDNKDGNQHDED